MNDYETLRSFRGTFGGYGRKAREDELREFDAALDRLQGETGRLEDQVGRNGSDSAFRAGVKHADEIWHVELQRLTKERDEALAMYRATAKAELTLQAENTRLRAALERITKGDYQRVSQEWTDGYHAAANIARQALAHTDTQETPERCPTCGSSDPDYHMVTGPTPDDPRQSYGMTGTCPDPWHTDTQEIGKPASDPSKGPHSRNGTPL